MPLNLQTRVLEVLKAFAAMFTQPLEQQDLPTSLRAAGVAITLAASEGFVVLGWQGAAAVRTVPAASLVIVLAWMTGTGILSRAPDKQVPLARNLSLVSFWIAATLVFVIVAYWLFPGLQHAKRFAVVSLLLFVAVPVQAWGIMSLRRATWAVPALWLSMGALAWAAIY